jgi:hypothetical protein
VAQQATIKSFFSISGLILRKVYFVMAFTRLMSYLLRFLKDETFVWT